MGRAARTKREQLRMSETATVAEPTEPSVSPNIPSLPPGTYVLPQAVLDALIGYGLKTEPGQALVNGYRLGVPELHPSKGGATIICGDGLIRLGAAARG